MYVVCHIDVTCADVIEANLLIIYSLCEHFIITGKVPFRFIKQFINLSLLCNRGLIIRGGVMYPLLSPAPVHTIPLSWCLECDTDTPTYAIVDLNHIDVGINSTKGLQATGATVGIERQSEYHGNVAKVDFSKLQKGRMAFEEYYSLVCDFWAINELTLHNFFESILHCRVVAIRLKSQNDIVTKATIRGKGINDVIGVRVMSCSLKDHPRFFSEIGLNGLQMETGKACLLVCMRTQEVTASHQGIEDVLNWDHVYLRIPVEVQVINTDEEKEGGNQGTMASSSKGCDDSNGCGDKASNGLHGDGENVGKSRCKGMEDHHVQYELERSVCDTLLDPPERHVWIQWMIDTMLCTEVYQYAQIGMVHRRLTKTNFETRLHAMIETLRQHKGEDLRQFLSP